MSSATRTWTPAAAVRARGDLLQGQIRHAFGSIVGAGEQGQLPVRAGTEAMKHWLAQHFPGDFTSIGAERYPASRWHVYDAAVPQHRDLHEEGRALDCMSTNADVLERHASAFVWHADVIGLQYVLTEHYEWSASRLGAAWEAYTGSDPHTDHIHVELSPDVADDATRVVAGLDAAWAAGWDAPGTSPASANSRAAWWIGGAVAGVVGFLAWITRRPGRA